MPILPHRHHWKLSFRSVPLIRDEIARGMITNRCIDCSALELRSLQGGEVAVIDGDTIEYKDGVAIQTESVKKLGPEI